MSKPAQAAVDPVDGTLYVIYTDGAVWAYRPPAEERLQEGWRKVEGGPERASDTSASTWKV